MEYKKIPYQGQLLNFSDGEHKTPEFVSISPRARVPVLCNGDFSLYESIAILQYLEAKFPKPALFGQDPEETGLIWQSIQETSNYIEGPVFVFSRGIFFDRVEEQRTDIIAARQGLESEMERIDNNLSDTGFLYGESLSAADICLYPLLQFMGRAANKNNSTDVCGKLQSFPDHFANIASWNLMIEALPGYERTYPPLWK